MTRIADATSVAAVDESSGRHLFRAVPIWVRNIETARQQTEQAIVSLSERFAGIVSRLGTVLGHEARAAGGRSADAETRQSEQDLNLVVDALRAIASSRDELAREIRGLVA